MSTFSKLLINENPLIVLPSLAVALKSVDAAVVLQQIHYWIADPRAPERDGVKWHYATFDQWHLQFPWMCLRTLKSIVQKLEDQKLIISKEFNRLKGNRTKWYTIDYKALSDIEIASNTHSATFALPSCKPCTTIVQNLHDLYKEEETTKEITKDIGTLITEGDLFVPEIIKESLQTKIAKADVEEMFERFWFEYPRKIGKQKAKEHFLKLFANLSTDKAENLLKEIFDGLLANLTESVFYEDIQKQNPHWDCWYPNWKHGDGWLKSKRWMDSYITNFDEVKYELSKKNASRRISRKDQVSAVLAGTYTTTV